MPNMGIKKKMKIQQNSNSILPVRDKEWDAYWNVYMDRLREAALEAEWDKYWDDYCDLGSDDQTQPPTSR
jgi:hypothetical protein